jgi:hypothetical protein
MMLAQQRPHALKTQRCYVNADSLRLIGNISNISRAGLYSDHLERLTVSVEGAEPLYAELRLPNTVGWDVGQKVLVMIIPAAPEAKWDVMSPNSVGATSSEPASSPLGAR